MICWFHDKPLNPAGRYFVRHTTRECQAKIKEVLYKIDINTLHKIEGEVLAEVAATGNHSKRILDMIRAPAALDYPKDDRPASFVGHDFVPIVFGAIEDAWRRVN